MTALFKSGNFERGEIHHTTKMDLVVDGGFDKASNLLANRREKDSHMGIGKRAIGNLENNWLRIKEIPRKIGKGEILQVLGTEMFGDIKPVDVVMSVFSKGPFALFELGFKAVKGIFIDNHVKERENIMLAKMPWHKRLSYKLQPLTKKFFPEQGRVPLSI